MEIKKTVTSIFMVPTLKIDRNKLRENNFINAYIKDKNRDVQYENAVYLLFRPTDFHYFRDFVDGEYDRTLAIIDDYDYKGDFVVLVYQLNPRFSADFELIKKGKYSETSKAFQDLFPKVVKIMKNGLHRDELSLQTRIFNKADDLREYWENRLNISLSQKMEVWDGFNEENETLDITKIRELV